MPVRCTISGVLEHLELRRALAPARRRAAQPGRDHRHAQAVLHRVVDHRADDHHRVLGGELLDRVHHLVVLLHLEPGRRGDVDQHAARAGEVDVLEQRALHRLLAPPAARDRRRSAVAEPIIAMPTSPITVRTSAKSTLTRPGLLMTSAMPDDGAVQHVVRGRVGVEQRDVLAEHLASACRSG